MDRGQASRPKADKLDTDSFEKPKDLTRVGLQSPTMQGCCAALPCPALPCPALPCRATLPAALAALYGDCSLSRQSSRPKKYYLAKVVQLTATSSKINEPL